MSFAYSYQEDFTSWSNMEAYMFKYFRAILIVVVDRLTPDMGI